jgi:hypothetical protein
MRAPGAVLCPADPTISNLAAPLTIDTHAHFFNGSDLQIREFLSQTTVGWGSELYPLVNSMAALLQMLGWHVAPNAESELAAMARYAALIKQCEGIEQMRRVTSSSFQEGYSLGRQQLQSAADATYQTPVGAAVLGPKAARTGLGPAIASRRIRKIRRAKSTWLSPAWWITTGGSHMASRPRRPCPIRWM